jgi:hypothetical protein
MQKFLFKNNSPAFFCSSKFLDDKNASEKKWNLIMKVRRVQGGFCRNSEEM